MSRECDEYEITVSKLLKVVHRYTERIKIYVVGDEESIKDKVKEFYLTEDFSKNEEEIDRVLKYYADVPVWNLHVSVEQAYSVRYQNSASKGVFTVASIVANCHYQDIREGYLREKEDIRKAKAKAYRERRTVAKKSKMDGGKT